MMMQIPAGTKILIEDEVNMDMYKIITGSVELYVGYGTENESLLGILSKGSYFGEIGLLTQKPAIYTVIAYSDVTVLRITMSDIDEYIKTNHHDILEILQHMANTMYNMQYSMQLVMDDMEEKSKFNSKKDDMVEYKAFLSKQFAKYNVQSRSSRYFSR